MCIKDLSTVKYCRYERSKNTANYSNSVLERSKSTNYGRSGLKRPKGKVNLQEFALKRLQSELIVRVKATYCNSA